MKNQLVEFLLEEANKCKYKTVEYIQPLVEYDNNDEKYKINRQIACVYGFWIDLREAKKKKVFKETDCGDIKPIVDNWYPLYWGKDIYPGSRINAHITEPKGTGTMELSKYSSLENCKIICGGILVELKSYEMFEQNLHSNYKPILGSSKKGRSINR